MEAACKSGREPWGVVDDTAAQCRPIVAALKPHRLETCPRPHVGGELIMGLLHGVSFIDSGENAKLR